LESLDYHDALDDVLDAFVSANWTKLSCIRLEASSVHYAHTCADAHIHTCKVTHTRRKPRSRGKKYGRVRAHERLSKRRRKKLRLSTGGLVKEKRLFFTV